MFDTHTCLIFPHLLPLIFVVKLMGNGLGSCPISRLKVLSNSFVIILGATMHLYEKVCLFICLQVLDTLFQGVCRLQNEDLDFLMVDFHS